MKKRILIWVIVMVFAVAITRCATAQKAPKEQPETKPLIINIPEQSTYGTVTVYDKGDVTYQYTGDNIKIINSGRDGNPIEIEIHE